MTSIARLVYGVPVWTRTKLIAIEGRSQVEAVEIEQDGVRRHVACDGVILTGQFVPEAALLVNQPDVMLAGNVQGQLKTSGVCWREGRAAADIIARELSMKVVAVDQGTTGTKSFTLNEDGSFISAAAFEHRQIYPQAGWVEHDPEELLRHVTEAIAAAGSVDAIGIDNQGETVIAWDADTGRPVHNAIVWQDDRTKDVTEKLKAEGAEELTLKIAGLPLDPYFSASKLRWFIDHVPEAKDAVEARRLRLGTSDAFFLARLTGTYATDVTTASRTSLMALETCTWDPQLCDLFGVPMECLPEIRATAGIFGAHKGVPVTARSRRPAGGALRPWLRHAG